MVLIEVMLCGIPMVSTNCTFGSSKVLLEGKCGFMVHPDDPEVLAISMQKLLEDENPR
jgi:glycosyltransferase involved in cell wall biosynthesis